MKRMRAWSRAARVFTSRPRKTRTFPATTRSSHSTLMGFGSKCSAGRAERVRHSHASGRWFETSRAHPERNTPRTMPEGNLEKTREGFEALRHAFQTRDFDAYVEEYIDPEVEWVPFNALPDSS